MLTFKLDSDEVGFLMDEETGSRWEVASGAAVNGPLRGEKLPALVVTPAFEFGWYAYFPDSETYMVVN